MITPEKMDTKFRTSHHIITADARKLDGVQDSSINLVVTSPPYPMIAMWDELFSSLNSELNPTIINNQGQRAFELMHIELDKVWLEVARVVKSGGIVCINIGDATRTINSEFKLYPNHIRIIEWFRQSGFSILPYIIWKKPTNAPNKFMGSGTLPVGAYVTLEHEFLLLFRKDKKRTFDKTTAKASRRRSAFFWEERNQWFSDIWNIAGGSQRLTHAKRNRSAAFPLEIPHRLINMYSVVGDMVLDPFNGTGTTTLAAIANGRNSLGIDLDSELNKHVRFGLPNQVLPCQKLAMQRIQNHEEFVQKQGAETFGHYNAFYHTPVKTAQETSLILPVIDSINIENNAIQAFYK